LLYGQQFFLKFYRRLEEGVQCEIEVGKFLTETAGYKNTPRFAGSIEWRRPGMQPTSIVLLEEFVANEGSGWSFTLDSLTRFYEQVLVLKDADSLIAKTKQNVLSNESKVVLDDLIGGRFFEAARLLGQRTAEMHLALASRDDDPAFSPEPFSLLYQRSVYQSIRSNARTVFQALRKSRLQDSLKEILNEIFNSEQALLNFFRGITSKNFTTMRTRIHGDYHLGQTLYTGKDFVIIDFEGEPMLSMNARRMKRSPLRDVAGMIRSLQYAAHRVLYFDTIFIDEKAERLKPWADLWYERVSQVFLESYMESIKASKIQLIPEDKNDREFLLKVFILEKCVYEVGYELNTRPDWVSIPCNGLLYNIKHILPPR
jgi:maltose alpha-D-glucosyltransferase/alpha-amylase